MINFRMLKLSDPLLWISAGGLILISFFAIFSCTFAMQAKAGLDSLMFVKRQLFSLLVGLIGLSIFCYFDYKHLKKAAPILYIVMLLILLAVVFAGSRGNAAQRWLMLGPFSFQPSEFAKLFLVITLARFFADHNVLTKFSQNIYLLILTGLPFLLIFLQPDLGTALVFIFILIGLLTATGASPKLLIILVSPFFSIIFRQFLILWIIYLLLVALALFLSRSTFWDWVFILGSNIAVGLATPFIWGMLKPYQQMRILTFVNPGFDPYGAGYHSLQSKIAIGSGGFFGRGFLHGTQTQLQFIPEQFSDFIYSAIGEEFGFIGAGGVLILFFIMIWRALSIAREADDRFGTMLAAGIAVMTAFHVFANIGMAVGLLPVVGVPLPFVSYGGTSLMMNLIALGILQNIAMRREKLIF